MAWRVREKGIPHCYRCGTVPCLRQSNRIPVLSSNSRTHKILVFRGKYDWGNGGSMMILETYLLSTPSQRTEVSWIPPWKTPASNPENKSWRQASPVSSRETSDQSGHNLWVKIQILLIRLPEVSKYRLGPTDYILPSFAEKALVVAMVTELKHNNLNVLCKIPENH